MFTAVTAIALLRVVGGSFDAARIDPMGRDRDEIEELHRTLRTIGHYSQLLRSITELRDEGEHKGDHNMAALWDWLARQVADVRDTDARELQVAARDFSTPAEGEN